MKNKVSIAIFASGSGTNAENLILYFRNHPSIQVTLVVSNRPEAFVLNRAEKLKVDTAIFSGKDWANPQYILNTLKKHHIDFIVLAGYLRLIPEWLIDAFPQKIINIHPALLPAYGGKGMYGDNVHNAVIEAKESASGISIHYVNAKYDEGDVIFQAKCTVLPTDTPQSLAHKIHTLEYEHFPKVTEQVISTEFKSRV